MFLRRVGSQHLPKHGLKCWIAHLKHCVSCQKINIHLTLSSDLGLQLLPRKEPEHVDGHHRPQPAQEATARVSSCMPLVVDLNYTS